MKTLIIATIFLPCTAGATPRTSTDYTITNDTLDFGGQLVISGFYSTQGSITNITGVLENSESGITTLRHGYIGQLYEMLGYGLLAADYYPPEEGSTQIIPVRTADDGTNLIIPTTGFTFARLEGPITGISPAGLVETASVYEHTQAIVGATSGQFAGQLQLNLFVQNTLPDNYSTYAADGLPDAWQRQYFGHDNPLAAALLDPDGDGQNNRFEYIAGIIPTDPASRFELRIELVPGEATHRKLRFSPALPDRTYTVKSNTVLAGGTWADLIDQTDDQLQPVRTITDRNATPARNFYQVEIIKP